MKQTSVTVTVTAATAKEALNAHKTLAGRYEKHDDVLLLQKTLVIGQDATTLTAVYDLVLIELDVNMGRVTEMFFKILFPNLVVEITSI